MHFNVILALALASALSGCALLNAYPKSQDYDSYGNNTASSSDDNDPGAPLHCPATKPAMKKARCERYTYEGHLRKEGYANSLDAVGLLGLAGVVAYKGAQVPSSKKNVSALTLGGVAWYGAYSYLYAKPREAIYITGITAVNCAIEQALPWLRADPTAFKVKIDALAGRISLLEGAVETAKSAEAEAIDASKTCPVGDAEEKSLASMSEQLSSLEDQLQADRKVLSDAQEFARTLQVNHDSADDNLSTSVDAIHAEILKQLAAQQPDPSKLSSQLSIFAPKSTGSSDSGKSTSADTKLPTTLGRVGTQKGPAPAARKCDLAAKNAKFASTISNAISVRASHSGAITDMKDVLARQPQDTATSGSYRQCVALAAASGSPLQFTQVSSGDPSLKLPDGKLQLAFSGGVPPYTASVLLQPPNGTISATPQTISSGLSYVVVITVDDKVVSNDETTSKTYTLLLSDSTGSSKVAHFRLQAADSSKDVKKGTDGGDTKAKRRAKKSKPA